MTPSPQFVREVICVLDVDDGLLLLLGSLIEECCQYRLVYHRSDRLPQEDGLQRCLLIFTLTRDTRWTVSIHGHCIQLDSYFISLNIKTPFVCFHPVTVLPVPQVNSLDREGNSLRSSFSNVSYRQGPTGQHGGIIFFPLSRII